MPALPDPDSEPIGSCWDCGYRLDGLPSPGRCPECGLGFDHAKEAVIAGWGTASHATLSTARPREVFRTMIGPVACCGLIILGMRNSLITLLMGIVCLWTIVYSLHRRRRNLSSHLPPLRLFLAERGWSLREGSGPVTMREWSSVDEISVKQRSLVRFELAFLGKWRQEPLMIIDCDGDWTAAGRILNRIDQFRQRVTPRNDDATTAPGE